MLGALRTMLLLIGCIACHVIAQFALQDIKHEVYFALCYYSLGAASMIITHWVHCMSEYYPLGSFCLMLLHINGF